MDAQGELEHFLALRCRAAVVKSEIGVIRKQAIESITRLRFSTKWGIYRGVAVRRGWNADVFNSYEATCWGINSFINRRALRI